LFIFHNFCSIRVEIILFCHYFTHLVVTKGMIGQGPDKGDCKTNFSLT
jgi:hypothetical protein